MNKNLGGLPNAMEKIWKRIQAKTVAVERSDGKGANLHFNGDVRKLCIANGITAAETTLY